MTKKHHTKKPTTKVKQVKAWAVIDRKLRDDSIIIHVDYPSVESDRIFRNRYFANNWRKRYGGTIVPCTILIELPAKPRAKK